MSSLRQIGGKIRNIWWSATPTSPSTPVRQGDLRNILSFERDYPEAGVILLEQNYRSTRKILETASHVISANKQRKPTKLWTENEAGESVNVIETYTEQEEAQFIVSEIEGLTESHEANLSDCA